MGCSKENVYSLAKMKQPFVSSDSFGVVEFGLLLLK